MKPLTSFTLWIALASSAIPILAEEPTGDLAKLQGSWTSKVGPQKNIQAVMTIKNETIELKVTRPDNQEIVIKGEIKLDEKASPKTADWVKFTAPDGQEIPDIKLIYKIDGDAWTTCSGGSGNDRPTKFEAGEDGPPNLAIWTRVKPDEKAPPKN